MTLHFVRGALVIVLSTAIFCILSVPASATGQKPVESQPPSASSAAAPAALPLAEVASQATEVSNFLRTLSSQVLAPNPEVNKIREELTKVNDQIVLELAATEHLLEEPSTLSRLQTQEQLWKRLQLQTSGLLSKLKARASQLQGALDHLAALHETWTRTRDAAVSANAPGPILQEIQETLADIDAAQPGLQSQHAYVLGLQSRVAQEVARCEKALSIVAQA